MTMNALTRVLLLFVAMTAVAGCTVFSAPDTPEYIQLKIDGAAAQIPVAERLPQTLLVTLPRAAPGYATTHFAYIQRDREMRYYGRHEWIAEPSRMIHSAVLTALDRGGRFAAVVGPQTGANADLRLDLEVLALHQDFRGVRESELVLTVRAQLIATVDRQVIATRTFDLREPAGANPIAGAAAADRALARMLEELAAFCADES